MHSWTIKWFNKPSVRCAKKLSTPGIPGHPGGFPLSWPPALAPRTDPMVRTETPVCDFGQPAPDFSLPGVDGKTWRLQDVRGPKGLLVMFICNHCPYVQAIRERLVRDANELSAHGINSV